MKETKIVIGSTFGDEGKGATVQWLCKKAIEEGKKPVVIRYCGGPQASHTVKNNGIEHVCSSYGSGVLLGVPTVYLSSVFVDPISLDKERKALLTKGIKPKLYGDSFNAVTRIITPYDVAFNQQDKETLANGTCGKGIYAAQCRYNYQRRSGNPERLLEDASNWYGPEIQISQEIKDKFIECTNRFLRTYSQVNLRDFDVLIYESSQGLLLDPDYGFHPHTTPCSLGFNTFNLSDGAEIYLVTRTYTTRHGNGYTPKFPIEIPSWKKETNVNNQFQGEFKTGILELPLLKRAFDRHNIMNLSKRRNFTTNLVVTHTDLIDKGVINKFANETGFINFNNTDEALRSLVNNLDGYISIDNVYYSDNPDSNFKQFI